ncbi:carboxylating nicotinate-nucleotide diphosphorylase [bacterium endosymbiont of Pedicinus badii]|uniref:carboxylating nicotinate-nucleotide diphosphorylase n=1 Tax=bacterium endosymbiont of Pedicinus badii TaxID=1719126 RepID=UPI0009B9AACB|nr:carboxylating nicotinate-nucleotide diphosphorylase [bacterium endosymbiont of Pedicinus badii]OQM34228.1 hypothetical protein AOQ89_02750 [bacterium endosymbiont of Pedicinus badii]
MILKKFFEKRRKKILKKIKKEISFLVQHSLKEDILYDKKKFFDITGNLCENKKTISKIFSKEKGILCGKKWVEEVFQQIQKNSVQIEWHVKEGKKIFPNQNICNLFGPARVLLAGERTALNFLQMLSGISSTTRKYVDCFKGTKTILLDTRKNIPCFKYSSKYAVLCGGAESHRINLSDAFLIKENHIFSVGSIQNTIQKALSKRKKMTFYIPIEVEVENIEELQQAIKNPIDIIMLDNFSYKNILKAIKIIDRKIPIEVSGNIDIEFAKKIANLGIDFVSVGDITKNIKVLNFSMRFCNE